jgi:hypothetical protein
MNVHPSKASACKAMPLYKTQELGVLGDRSLRESRQQSENLAPVPNVTACKFTHDEGVTGHLTPVEQSREAFVPP